MLKYCYFLISLQKHILWYLLEATYLGTSNEYPQHVFCGEIRKNIYLAPLLSSLDQNRVDCKSIKAFTVSIYLLRKLGLSPDFLFLRPYSKGMVFFVKENYNKETKMLVTIKQI